MSNLQTLLEISEAKAIEALRATNFNETLAIDFVFGAPSPSKAGPGAKPEEISKKAQDIFANYVKGKENKKMESDEVLKFLSDLGIGGEDPITYVLFFIGNAKVPQELTDQEFIRMMNMAKCSSISELKSKLPQLKKDYFDDRKKFKMVYNYAWVLCLASPDIKSTTKETATSIISSILPDNSQVAKFVDFVMVVSCF